MTPPAGPSSGGLCAERVELVLDGRRILHAVDLAVAPGVPVAVTGPSGSGKTVLCLVLAGALAPTSGRVLLHGRPLSSDRVARVGLVLQSHGLVEGLTAGENIALPLQERGLEPAEIDRRVQAVSADVGLAAEVDRFVDDLSGGERQRVGIARALAGDPEALVADEPTSELDPDNRERVLELLLGRDDAVVVVATDDPAVIRRFPRVVTLDDAVATVRDRAEWERQGGTGTT